MPDACPSSERSGTGAVAESRPPAATSAQRHDGTADSTGLTDDAQLAAATVSESAVFGWLHRTGYRRLQRTDDRLQGRPRKRDEVTGESGSDLLSGLETCDPLIYFSDCESPFHAEGAPERGHDDGAARRRRHDLDSQAPYVCRRVRKRADELSALHPLAQYSALLQARDDRRESPCPNSVAWAERNLASCEGGFDAPTRAVRVDRLPGACPPGRGCRKGG
jgi:hypothetical protein